MNRNMLVKAFIFVAGATIGSAVTWKVIKNKYEQITQEAASRNVMEDLSNKNKLIQKSTIKDSISISLTLTILLYY